MTETQLYLQDVHRSFDGFKAINGLSLVIAKGELRAVVGPNGAGKTTMLDIITGKTRPDRAGWSGTRTPTSPGSTRPTAPGSASAASSRSRRSSRR